MSQQAAIAAPPDGEALYNTRCKSCHEPAQPGAPDRTVLRQMKPSAIVRSLETGKMKAMGSTLTPDEKKVAMDGEAGQRSIKELERFVKQGKRNHERA